MGGRSEIHTDLNNSYRDVTQSGYALLAYDTEVQINSAEYMAILFGIYDDDSKRSYALIRNRSNVILSKKPPRGPY